MKPASPPFEKDELAPLRGGACLSTGERSKVDAHKRHKNVSATVAIKHARSEHQR